MPLEGILSTDSDSPAPTPSSGSTRPLGLESCRFFKVGACRNGDSCRFRHDATADEAPDEAIQQRARHKISEPGSGLHEKQEIPKAQPAKSTESNARDLGGALVKFGPGAHVLRIEPAATSTARLQMCNVNCTWYQPSKTATLEFTSSQSMEEVSQNLGKTKILNRKLECRTAIDKNIKPWRCLIKIGNLDVSTTSEMLKEACGKRRPRAVAFGDSSYSSSTEAIGHAIESLFSSRWTVVAWNISSIANGPQIKATATFSTTEQATRAIAEFNGYRLPQLGGSKIRLSRVFKAKFSILSSMYSAISSEISNVQQDLRSNNYLEIKCYPSADEAQRFTTLHIISSTAQEVGKAKAAVEKILTGHIARGGRDIVWHGLFLKPEGTAYLNRLGKEHDVFIYRNARKCVLSLYGTEENKAAVESALVKAVDDLAVSTFKIELDELVPIAVHQAGYRRIVEKLGKTAARLNVMASPRLISIHGSVQNADWAKAILREEFARSSSKATNVEEDLTCAVCWCEVTEMYTTLCGHVYDRDCFVNQCLSAGDNEIPLKCLGASGGCQAVIPFPELESALTRDQLDKLLENSFTSHVRTHPGQYRYCPTAGCDQVYEVTDDNRVFTCSTCLTSICTHCGSVSHEGLTCEQYKSAILCGDDAFAEWKKNNDARDCPKCGCTIQKSEGCNHMECRACGAHICWVCMRVFREGSDTYRHLAVEHGGCYDPGFGDI